MSGDQTNPQPGQQQGTEGAQQPAAGLQRPDGISEAEWSALGDPGKAAIVRERQARAEADRRYSELQRSQQQPPQQVHQAPAQHQQQTAQQGQQSSGPQTPQDLQAMVTQAVQAAFQPFADQQQQAAQAQIADQARKAVSEAAGQRLHDPADALVHIDLRSVTDDRGAVDTTKLSAALDKLLETKPYLGKPVDGRRRAPAGSLVGAGGATPSGSLEERASAMRARMERAAGVKFAGRTTSS